MDGNRENLKKRRTDIYSGTGMDALMSAIEHQGRTMQSSPSSGYSILPASVTPSLDEAEKERILAATGQQSSYIQSLQANALAASQLWNPMNDLMQYSLRLPNLAGLLPQAGLPRLPQLAHEREILRQAEQSSKTSDSPDTAKTGDVTLLPFGYPPGVPYLPRHGLVGLPPDKVTSAHDVGINGIGYPSPSALNPFLKMPGYPPLLPGTTGNGLLPQMAFNPSVMGAVGAYSPYYPGGLMTPMPHVSQVDQSSLLSIPVNSATPPSQSRTPEATRTGSPARIESRPQSGGYHLPLKDTLQRRLSAPNAGSQFRLPMHNDHSTRLGLGKRPTHYPPIPGQRAPLPPHLVAPSDPNKQMNRQHSHIDSKSIGKRISDIISQNEKILFSPQLDRVKPRRVTRRNSVDTCTPPVSKHNPLTAVHSAPRSLDTRFTNRSVVSTDDSNSNNEKQSFLSVPNADHNVTPSTSGPPRPNRTFIPDPRRDPHARPYIPGVTNQEQPAEAGEHSYIKNGHADSRPMQPANCSECGVTFINFETLEAHRELQHAKRSCSVESNDSGIRRSVIQHTPVSDDTPPPHPDPPALKITPPDSNAIEYSPELKDLRKDSVRSMHKDLYRTRSADAAILPATINTSTHKLPTQILDVTQVSHPSPAKSDPTNDSSQAQAEAQSQKSSIPTNKLPPKKKQLQLMRCNSANPTSVDPPRSPTLETVRHSSSENIQNSKGSPQQRTPHPNSLPLESQQTRRSLPPWISLDEQQLGASPLPSTVYMAQPSARPGMGNTTLLSSPTSQKSPTSPKSPTRRSSPSRGSRSPSRSPTSNLESTVPRSNYKLLLHQLSLRNMQDMGYLSEAYHHSKDKDLKRNIAHLLWSSKGSDGSSSKRARPFLGEAPNMEELYPGKAMLARRLSPNAESRSNSLQSTSPTKTTLSQSRSRPYESSLDTRTAVTRSHSVGSDVNRNIKEYLENKSRNEKLSSSGPTKAHKPLTRTNANARYLLKCPTRPNHSSGDELPKKAKLEARKSLGSYEGVQKTKVPLKRVSSCNPDPTSDYQVKRQKLVPIQSSSSSPSILPSSLVTANVPRTPARKELPKIKSINPHTVQTPFLLHPHGSPSFGYEPHPTFCSLVSPQPMYVELKQSALSMYSQWAVSEPMLPKGMTVMDIFKNTRLLKSLSPYISYNSLFTERHLDGKDFNVVESKDYDSDKRKKTEEKPDEARKNQFKPIKSGNEESLERTKQEDRIKRKWLFSRMVGTSLHAAHACYTSCHNKLNVKKSDSLPEVKKPEATEKTSPRLPPPKVFIQPPSPEPGEGDPRSPRSSEIIALEFSDCDTDDDAIKTNSHDHFLMKSGKPMTPVTLASSCDAAMVIDSSSSDDELSIDLTQDSSPDDNIAKNGKSEGHRSPSVNSNVLDNNAVSSQVKNHEAKPLKLKFIDSSEDTKDLNFRNHKKIRRSRKERNAASPRLQKMSGSPGSPDVVEDPSLAVHPTGACSDDPAKICALCRMKAKGETESGCSDDGSEKSSKEDVDCSGKSATLPDRPETPVTPQSTPRTPTSARPRTPVPLTVSVPKRNRDRSGSKSGNQPLTPGILDKARGKGTTQHWVTTTELQAQQLSPKMVEPLEEKGCETPIEAERTASNPSFSSTERFTYTPPNKNPVLELNLQKSSSEALSPPMVSTPNGGFEALAAVVSGVMRSAAIQSKKKTVSSKNEMTELLSHSRPLIPGSERNGTASKNHKKEPENCDTTVPTTENSLGSLANLTSSVGANRCKPSMRHLSLTARESELFLHKANGPKSATNVDRKSESESLKLKEECPDDEDDHHSDGAKEDLVDGDGESSNPRPHKCTECKVAFRIAGHLAKHLRSKGHVIAMQKKTLNRLKQQKLSTGQEATQGSQGGGLATSSVQSPENQQPDELLNQLGEAQVRALFEGNEEYAEINTGMDAGSAEILPETSDDEGDGQAGGSDLVGRPFKCIACKVAFRFQGHLDRHFRSNTHLLAIGHFERDSPADVASSSEDFFNNNSESSQVEDEKIKNTLKSPDKQTAAAVLKVPENDIPLKPFVDTQNTNSHLESDQGLADTPVNQINADSDWSNPVPAKMNISKVTVNGLDSHNNNSIRSTIQSKQSQCYEATPTLQEMPLPSTSPVPQLSC